MVSNTGTVNELPGWGPSQKKKVNKTATGLKLISKQRWDFIISASAAMDDCQLRNDKAFYNYHTDWSLPHVVVLQTVA